MRIGILTQPLGHNYGGILQNWALQQVLKGLGHSPLTINYYAVTNFKKIKWYIYIYISYLIKQIIFHPTRSKINAPWRKGYCYNLKKFVNKNIISTAYFPILTDNLLREKKIEAILVGSDQVWRPKYNRTSLDYMFCDFGGELSTIPHSSYAASFGVDDWEFTPKETDKARKAIKMFDRISVREKSGCYLCSEELDAHAIHVLDPTMLLSSDTYNELISDKTINDFPENFVGVYMLDITTLKFNIIEEICCKVGLRPVYFINKDKKGILRPVEEWLAMFNRCSFIVTDSFHGTVFSIIYRKPFISIANENRGVERFTSLLNIVGLESRLIYDDQTSNISNILESKVDWDTVSKKIDEYKTMSMNFIRETIEPYIC